MVSSEIFCSKSLGKRDDRADDYAPQEVSITPSGDSQVPRNGCRALTGLEAIGSRMKNSRSLQSLETATLHSMRNVVERSEELGSNLRQKYGSHVDIALGRYQQVEEEEG